MAIVAAKTESFIDIQLEEEISSAGLKDFSHDSALVNGSSFWRGQGLPHNSLVSVEGNIIGPILSLVWCIETEAHWIYPRDRGREDSGVDVDGRDVNVGALVEYLGVGDGMFRPVPTKPVDTRETHSLSLRPDLTEIIL